MQEKPKLECLTKKTAEEARKMLIKRLKDRPEFADVLVVNFHIFDDRRKHRLAKGSFCLVVVLKKFLSATSTASVRVKEVIAYWPNTVKTGWWTVPVVYVVMGKFANIEKNE